MQDTARFRERERWERTKENYIVLSCSQTPHITSHTIICTPCQIPVLHKSSAAIEALLLILFFALFSFTLKAIQCPQPLVPINGRIDGTSGANYQRRYAVGALVTFSCTEGHSLVGEASIVCTETGLWSHQPPFCKAQCPYPGDPPNGLLAPLKFHYDPGDELTVQCRPGFVEVTNINSGNGPTNRPHCLAAGNWSAPVPTCRNYEDM